MAKSKHTKPVEPVVGDRGTSVMIDGNCYVKSTDKTSTWQVPASDISNDDVCSAIDSGPNIMDYDNIDWSKTGIYSSTNDHVPFQRGSKLYPDGDESKKMMVDWEKNPFMSIEDGKWKFTYDASAPERTRMPWYDTTRPQFGFNFQYVVKFREPVDVPAKSTVFMAMQLTQDCGTWCGTKPNTKNTAQFIQVGVPQSGCGQNHVMGGVYQQEVSNNIPTKLLPQWPSMVCSRFRYFSSPGHDWQNRGMTGVNWVASQSIFMGCGPTGQPGGPFRFRVLALGMTGAPRILTEGLDF